eukprot:NODE_1492_length_853_cov_195.090796_g1237_i0.p1 GENE.NODE_1492_length_853_cov_195.090796_g1237_i0~~NODE_1492_length_853_cov_195.090796_g1237_i0.p1  ORF type:complete len:133 (-),score=50.18 NODE_1492_length_853_cov_195.090796_g1237_i0:317-715(-)
MGFKVTPAEKDELLVTFAALILNDDKAPITAENITKLIKAAGAEVEPYWPKLFASLLEGQDVTKLLLNAGGGGGGGAPAAAGGETKEESGKGGEKGKAAGKAEAGKKGGKEKKPEPEEEKEEEEDMGFNLFE